MTSTGMPEPSSRTVIDSSGWMVTSTRSQRPASASSTELSTTSKARWWSPREPVEPMYMPGRFRTGSRPFEDGDVLCGIGCFGHHKKPCKYRYLRAEISVSERVVGRGHREAQRGRSRRPARGAPRSSIAGGELDGPVAGPPAVGSGHLGAVAVRLLRRRLRQVPDGESQRSRRGSRRAARAGGRGSPARAGRARTPTPTTTCSRAACRRGRFAPATRSRRPSRRPPRASAPSTSGMPPWGPNRASSRRISLRYPLHRTSPGETVQELRRLARQRVGGGRGDQRLAAGPAPARPAPAAGRGSSSESTSSSRSSGGLVAPLARAAQPRRAGGRAPRCAALPASRTSAGPGSRTSIDTS